MAGWDRNDRMRMGEEGRCWHYQDIISLSDNAANERNAECLQV